MTPKTSPARCLAPILFATGLALAGLSAGCASSHQNDDEMTNAVVSGEQKRIAMEGTESFFGGKLVAKVTLGRGVGKGLQPAKKKFFGATSTDTQEGKEYHDYAENENKMLLGSPLPPVTLHLMVTNPGTEPITVRLDDFESELGNFAIDPDSLTIPPGQTAEPTSMVSELGVTSDEIPFKVRLSIGSAHETRTVVVRSLIAPPKAP